LVNFQTRRITAAHTSTPFSITYFCVVFMYTHFRISCPVKPLIMRYMFRHIVPSSCVVYTYIGTAVRLLQDTLCKNVWERYRVKMFN